MANRIISVCLILCLTVYASCNKVGLQKRLAMVEDRQDDVSTTHRGDFYDVNLRLDTLEAHLNASLEEFVNQQHAVETDKILSDTTLSHEVRIISQALSDEKSRWRREASAIKVSIKGLKQEVGSMRNTMEEIEAGCKKHFQDTMSQVTAEAQKLYSPFNVVKGDLQAYVDNTIQNVKDYIQSSIKGNQTFLRSAVSSVDQKCEDIVQNINEVKVSVGAIKTYVDSSVKTSVKELKTYVDSSIRGIEEEILKALRDSPQAVAPTTGQTTTLTTTQAPDQTTTLATTTAHKQSTIQTTTSPVKLPSCLELHRNGERQSGVYTIYPLPSNKPVHVYCDMDTDGGGWTVFQRRQDGSVNFNRTWAEYASGFGNVSGEFWLGNDLISSLTSRGPHELRIDMKDYANHSSFANYGRFQVSPSDANYALVVGGFSGSAGDSLSDLSGMAFTTQDRDNDQARYNCAQERRGGWWYNNCAYSRLNGRYGQGHGWSGLWWSDWTRSSDPLIWTEMKLRATFQA